MKHQKLVVVGGGAAGFFCAINAASLNPGLEVLILEKTHKLLSKVLVSGGGRCNLTHACTDIDEMASNYPRGNHFVKKAFHHFFTNDCIEWFEERGVKLKTEEDGRIFPVSNSSATIIECLMSEAKRLGIQIQIGSEVIGIKLKDGKFMLELDGLRSVEADFLCLACGGYSRTAQFEWLKKTGHSIEEPVPSLYTFNMPGNPITQLMGLSVGKAVVKVAGTRLKEQGALMITHWGMSGPAILKLSAWGARELAAREYRFKLLVNWNPQFNEQSLNERFRKYREKNSGQKIGGRNFLGLPQRLWGFMLIQSGINGDIRWADLTAKAKVRLAGNCCGGSFDVYGKTTFKEEFVTAGGIRLSEIHHASMESKLVPNLYFAGEVMDVDGITGGYNFQHAWTSGWIAAHSIATKSLQK